MATRIVLLFLFWTAIGLVFAAQTFLSAAVLGTPIGWERAFAYALPGWYVWAAMTPLVTALGRAVPITPGRTLFGLVFHLFTSALFSLAHTMVSVALMYATMPAIMAANYGESLRFHLQLGSHLNLLTYWTILGVSYALAYYRRAQQQELKAVQLAAGLAQAKLDALRMELNPHFLFNTLNTISSLIYSKPRAADQMIARLGELLRITLETRNRNEVTLTEEMRYLQAYLAIEQARFAGHLDVQYDVAPEAAGALVPSMILQPLVENAIRHGIAPNREGGALRIGARRTSGRLVLTVADSGRGLKAEGGGLGIGLTNTRARLQHMYGDDQALTIASADTGVLVTMALPYRAEAS